MKCNLVSICLIVAVVLAGLGRTGPAIKAASPPAPPAAAWLDIDLEDVVTGKRFKLADFKGKVVLIETMAVWCPLCTAQQREFQKLHAEMGNEIAFISLDIDANENADILRRHVEAYGFRWPFVIAPRPLAQKLAEQFGDRVLNPPSTPVIILNKSLQPHVLRFGVKSAADLKQEIAKYR